MIFGDVVRIRRSPSWGDEGCTDQILMVVGKYRNSHLSPVVVVWCNPSSHAKRRLAQSHPVSIALDRYDHKGELEWLERR